MSCAVDTYMSEAELLKEQAEWGLAPRTRHKLNVLQWIPCEHWEAIALHRLADPAQAVDLSPYVQRALDHVAQVGAQSVEQPAPGAVQPSGTGKLLYEAPSCLCDSETWAPAAYPPVLFFPAGTYTVHDLLWDGRVSIQGEHISSTRLQFYEPPGAEPSECGCVAASCRARSVLWVPPWDEAEVFPDPSFMGSLTDLTLMGYHPGGSFSEHLLVVGRPAQPDLRLERLSLITCRRDAIRLERGVQCSYFNHIHASGVGGHVFFVGSRVLPPAACEVEPLEAPAFPPAEPALLSITRMRWFSALPPGALIDYAPVLAEDWEITDPKVVEMGADAGKLLDWGAGLLRVVDQPGLMVALRHVKVMASTWLLVEGDEQRALVRVVPHPAVEGEVPAGAPLSLSLHNVSGEVRPDDHVALVWSHKNTVELLTRTIRVDHLALLYLAGDAAEAACSADTRLILPPEDDGLTQLSPVPGESAPIGLQGRHIEMLAPGTSPVDLTRRLRIGDLIFRAPPIPPEPPLGPGDHLAWVVVEPPKVVSVGTPEAPEWELSSYAAGTLAEGYNFNNGWWSFRKEVLAMGTVSVDKKNLLKLDDPTDVRHFTVGDNLLLLPPEMPPPTTAMEEYELATKGAALGVFTCYVLETQAGGLILNPSVEFGDPLGPPKAFKAYRRSPGLARVCRVAG